MKTITILLLTSLAASAGSTFQSDDDHFAWASSTGWVDFHSHGRGNGVQVGDSRLAGFAWSPNVGWIHFGDGVPSNAVRYANTDAADFGVNQDGAGNLSGLAWAPNIGWINFGWATADNANRPRFSLISGEFSGYAWSANTGWINLGSGLLRTDSIAITDSDGDGISDTWETDRAGHLGILGFGDADQDGISDKDEYLADTDPLDASARLQVISLNRDDALQSAELTWTSRPTRRYRVEKSTDLGTWQASLSWIAGTTGNFTSATLPAVEARAFYRVEAGLPLSSP